MSVAVYARPAGRRPHRLASIVVVVLAAAGLSVSGVAPALAAGTTLLTETFRGSSVHPGFVSVGTSFKPCLTASQDARQSPVPGCPAGQPGMPPAGDPVGSGALRLTGTGNAGTGSLLYDRALPFSAGLEVRFDHAVQGGSWGTGGITFFLSDGSKPLTDPGASGGDGPGVASWYLEVPLDELGSVQGTGPTRGDAMTPRSVQILVSPAPTATVTARIDAHDGAGFRTVLTAPAPAGAPPTFKFGLAAATGIHELQDLQVSTVEPLPPSLAVSLSHDAAFVAGGTGTFTLTASTSVLGGPEAHPVTVTGTLPAGLTVAAVPLAGGWDCSATTVGSTSASCSFTSAFPVAPGTTLTPVPLSVRIADHAAGSLTSTATIGSPDSSNPGSQGSDTVTVQPRANDDTARTTAGTAAVVDLLANDKGDLVASSVRVSDAPARGAARIDPATGRATYTPTLRSSGTDTFRYTVTDRQGAASTATVTVTVAPRAPNHPPPSPGDPATSSQGKPAAANHPPAISDGKGGRDTAAVTVTVTALRKAPVAVDDQMRIEQGSSATLMVLANDHDPDGDRLAVWSFTQPANASATCSGSTCTYMPDPGFHGIDNFTYTVSDGKGGRDTATVWMTVAAGGGSPRSGSELAGLPSGERLAVTGAATDWLLTAGLALLAIGCAALLASRRYWRLEDAGRQAPTRVRGRH